MQNSTDPFERFRDHPDLPSPTGVALQILELADRENTTVDEFIEVVKTDPALMQRILQIVNSPFAGLARPIADVRHAAILLGLKTVAVVALGVSLIESSEKITCQAFSYRTFWSESLARAVTAQQISSKLRFLNPQEAFAIGLLADIGRLVFASVCPKEYAQLLEKAEDNGELADLERSTFGLDHDELAACLMKTWCLPSVFCAAVQGRKTPQSLAKDGEQRACRMAEMLNLASQIGATIVKPVIDEDELSSLIGAAEPLGVSEDEFTALFDSVATEWRRTGKVLNISTKPVPTAEDIRARAAAKGEELRESGGLHHFVQDG